MSNLKELTKTIHRNAERTGFANELIKGLTPERYYEYLYNQYHIYLVLENCVAEQLPELTDIFRAPNIYADLKELERQFQVKATVNTLRPVVKDYERYVLGLDREGLIANIYVRHFGDMYGGQIIKKKNPGSGTMYDFNNVEDLKLKVRALLNDDMVTEATRCFEFAIQLFTELSE